jgi:hypothetical protein
LRISTSSANCPLNLIQKPFAVANKLGIRERSLFLHGVGLKPHAFFVCETFDDGYKASIPPQADEMGF